MPDINCGLGRLEAHVEHIEGNLTQHITQESKQQFDLMELVQEIRDKQQKMSGFWAGVAFIVSALASGLAIFFSKGGTT